ncbi:glucan endo-1,3-beta-glucosidase 4-like [Chenopodium quinoa]|uniref:glucan endo-1,3-beta-glucosidase 4-like n=1 Tax=Chenopodium quinoa TaxID=63459 RepID=UPI000B799D7A|nr:glucan endo-1,3-beta-glucosidase 4-like [Chenopodium quinoa]
MSSSSLKFLLPLLLLLVVPRISVIGDDGGQDDPGQQWCIADVQTPDDELQTAINWACGQQDVKCDMIQENQPCYQPNTTKDHADFVFNSYFQNHKNKGGNCYFNGAALITEQDPSHDNCHFEYLS